MQKKEEEQRQREEKQREEQEQRQRDEKQRVEEQERQRKEKTFELRQTLEKQFLDQFEFLSIKLQVVL
jgi:hypothetical protein